jgi:hypothetical protein
MTVNLSIQGLQFGNYDGRVSKAIKNKTSERGRYRPRQYCHGNTNFYTIKLITTHILMLLTYSTSYSVIQCTVKGLEKKFLSLSHFILF